jgi:flagellar biosynthesis protein FlhF
MERNALEWSETEPSRAAVSLTDALRSEATLARPAAGRPALQVARASLDELVGRPLEPGARDVAGRLLAHGASSEFVRAVLAALERDGARGTFAIDAAAAWLARSVPVLPSPKRPRTRASVPLFAFVGPAGAGKTTALVKLGRRLQASGRAVLFASLDPLSVPAIERVGSLAGDVDRGEVPLEPVRTAADLARLVRRAGRLDTVLLDTPGVSPRQTERLDELARELAQVTATSRPTTLLVLSAATGRGALRLATRAFAPFRPDGAVLTKLDETDEPGAAIEELVRARLPAAFLCDGQDARRHLVRASGEALSDLALRGHLAGSA